MDRDVYNRMNELENRHWWFSARRDIISELISRIFPHDKEIKILEAGCGSGGNLRMLQKFGSVDAFELDIPSCDAAKKKSGIDIRHGVLPDEIPFIDERFDLIALFDVLEHIEADARSLSVLADLLTTDGKILLTVPAFPAFWSRHDEKHHHFRRYTKQSLTDTARKADLKVIFSCYFNYLLLPFVLASRGVKKLSRDESPDESLPPCWLNWLLRRIFALERYIIGKVNVPAGLSLVAVLIKES
ncbi:MAG: class I SAM-dependent methyltransferase [Chlorobiaceae bacterium]|nr:class I SAM-dependent methyltransferase [Chlorobiaceae bacterium]